MRALLEGILTLINRRRMLVPVPFWLASIKGSVFAFAHRLSMGLVPAVITADQVKSLGQDSVVTEGAAGLEALGVTPTPMESVLPDYLWRYRPHGQFAELMQSADNLPKG